MLLCGSHISSICVFVRKSITCSNRPPIHKNCFSVLSPHPINPFRLSPWGPPVIDAAFDDDSSFLCWTLCHADWCHRCCKSTSSTYHPPSQPRVVPAGTCYCEKLVSKRGLNYFTVCAKQQCEFWAKTCACFTRHPGFVDVKLSVLGKKGKYGILMGSCHERSTHMVLINEWGGDQTNSLTQNTWIIRKHTLTQSAFINTWMYH